MTNIYPLRLGSGSSQGVYKNGLLTGLANIGVNIVDNKADADVVHLFDTNLFATRLNNATELMSIVLSSTPLVVGADDFFFAGDPSISQRPRVYYLNRWVHRRLLNLSDEVITFSQSAKNNISPEIKTPVTIVPHGVQPEYRTKTPTSGEDNYILYVGYGAPRKNPAAVIEFARLTNFDFYIVGANWEERLPHNVKKRENIRLPGFVSEKVLIELYNKASLFYLPSYHEAFGLPLVEAMASGTPVIGSDAYAIPEVVNDAGLFAEPDAVDSHLQLATTLLENPEKHQQYAKRAHSRSQEFSWERTARETVQVYQRILENGPS